MFSKSLAQVTARPSTLSPFQHFKVSAEEIQAELTKENIAPVKIESEDDAVKAADAEVIEALTVGAAEQAGAEAGEEAGAKAAQLSAQEAVAEAVKKAVAETAQQGWGLIWIR